MPGRTDGTDARYVLAINPLNRIARLRRLRVRNYVRGVPTGFTGILFVNSADRRQTVKRLEKTSKRKTASESEVFSRGISLAILARIPCFGGRGRNLKFQTANSDAFPRSVSPTCSIST